MEAVVALSNVFREPRRELIETGVGAVIVAGIVVITTIPATYIANTMTRVDPKFDYSLAFVLGVAIVVVAGLLTCLIAMIVHSVGEEVCDKLEKNGIRLRPKERFNGRW
jgi:uncharacterized BrkB/YihY/UPF0761 family membrane protein